MIALLFSVPIRLGNFAGLRLGETVREIGTGWWLEFEHDEMKADRPDLREAPPLLQSYIDQWVDEWRPVFGQPGPAFWPSIKGGGLAYTHVGTLISRITCRELGVTINPHLARDCAVYTIATAAGSQMGLASVLLQHTDPRTTNRYYNTGARTLAMQKYQALMDQLEGDVD